MAARPSPTVVRDAAGRRLRDVDDDGRPTAVLRWRAPGGLERACIRLPGGAWVRVEPGAGHDPVYGPVDRVRWGGGEADTTVFTALEYEAVDRIPVLAEPARLPAGAGTAVLNVVAALAADQRRATLAYDGPYPTEHLFLALLECFRYAPAHVPDPLAAFTAGTLGWAPAPHDRHFDGAGVYVQRRERVDKVVARGVAYYREDWQAVRRHAARRLRDDGDVVRAGLWALGEPVAEHLILTRAGDVLEILEPPAPPPARARMADEIVAGMVGIVMAQSAPALAPSIAGAARGLPVQWGLVPRDLIAFDGGLTISLALRAVIARRLRQAAGRRARVELAFAALAELAMLAGDHLRRLAQARLAGLAAPDLCAPEAPETAPRIAAGADALLQELA
ncbi:MAG: hypothetical protein WED01_12870 [Candidatus Rokuibacteriota bacterium]